ncbi:hypothetical protein [Pueribacillus theae]|nr:hypothetical protein [Pueribacillus theae]
MAYSFKVLLRDNVIEALYRDDRRRAKSQVDMSNKTLRDVVSKGFLQTHSMGHEYGNLYAMDELGFDYLGVKPYPTDFGRRELIKFYGVNRVFSTLCYKYRKDYTLEWSTDCGIGDAAAIVWEDSTRRKALKSYVIEFVKTNFRQDRALEIEEIQKRYAGKEVEGLPTKPSVIAATIDREDFELLVVEDGKECVSRQEIDKWAAS